MIVSPRPISDGEITLVERVLVDPPRITMQQAEDAGFKQFAYQIGAKVIKSKSGQHAEPVYFEFNAPSYTAAFRYAKDHRDDEREKFQKQAHAAHMKNVLHKPATNGEINRLKLTEG